MKRKLEMPGPKQLLTAAALVLALLLIFGGARPKDYYEYESSEPRYVEGYEQAADKSEFSGQMIAEGFEMNGLYPGEYQFTLEYESSGSGNTFEILDQDSWQVLAQGEYDPESSSMTVSAQIDRRITCVVVRSYLEQGELTLKSCEAVSLEPVYTDAWWALVLALVLAAAFWAALKKFRQGNREPLVLLGASVLVSLPLLTEHLQRGHDLDFHLTRIDGIAQALLGGQFPVRLNPDFLYGGGYLSPVMYPELFLYIPGVLCALGASVLFAFKVFCALIHITTAFVGYGAARQMLGREKALYFALFYLLNPYRLGDVYVRAAMGEALAMIFLPLVVVGLWQLFQQDYKKGFFTACLGITGVFQSHMITTLLVVVFGAGYALAVLIGSMGRLLKQGKRILTLCGSAAATLALNLWFLVPFLYYSGWDLKIYQERPDVGSASVYLFQAFVDYYSTGGEHGNTTTTGEIVVSMGMAVLIGLALYLFCLAQKPGEEEDPDLRTKALAAFWIGSIALFMASDLFPWQQIQQIPALDALASKLQFAWRCLIVSSVMYTLVLAVVFRQLKQKKSMAATVLVVFSLLGASMIGSGYLYENVCTLETKSDTWDHNTLYGGQYILSENDTVALSNRLKEGRVNALGQAQVTGSKRENLKVTFTYQNTSGQPAEFEVPLYYYGMHRAFLEDGTSLPVFRSEDTGLICVTVPAEQESGTVTVVYAERRLFRLAEVVSLAAALGLAGCFWYDRKRRPALAE